MRAAARFKEGRTLLQTTFQPAADALLAERLVSSALAGPSYATSFAELAQRASNTQPGNTIRGLARLYSSVARRSTGLPKSTGVGPTQQAGYRSPLASLGSHLPSALASAFAQQQVLECNCILFAGKCCFAKVNTEVLQ